jgi:hypothetical protein
VHVQYDVDPLFGRQAHGGLQQSQVPGIQGGWQRVPGPPAGDEPRPLERNADQVNPAPPEGAQVARAGREVVGAGLAGVGPGVERPCTLTPSSSRPGAPRSARSGRRQVRNPARERSSVAAARTPAGPRREANPQGLPAPRAPSALASRSGGPHHDHLPIPPRHHRPPLQWRMRGSEETLQAGTEGLCWLCGTRPRPLSFSVISGLAGVL